MRNRAFGLNDIRYILKECAQEFEILNQKRLLKEITEEMNRYRYMKGYNKNPIHQEELLNLDFKMTIKSYTPETDPFVNNPMPKDYLTRGFMHADMVIQTLPHIRRSILYINCLPTLFENRSRYQIKEELKITIIHEFIHVIQEVNHDTYDYQLPYEERFCEREANAVSHKQSFF